ncbi:hypothetical protein GTQ43_18000 [Nostoc sp. KVJ3]|uniref:hypothetical protein n=1 Tax=Nostoc sp. KVJ3 TaxID=457945 RepID=UPI0022381693|nr:hypothetical protein [Nostoc sp. KVJ3]MCW5315635.1 hypothetical protein [Nostoc sp. KVJ3]
MGYFANTKKASITEQINNFAIDAADKATRALFPKQVRNAIGQVVIANLTVQAIAFQSIKNVPGLLQQGTDIIIDPCNIYIPTDFGTITYRNPACNSRPTNTIITFPDSRILGELAPQDCQITIGLAQTQYFYNDGSSATLPGIDALIFGDITYNSNGANNQSYSPDHSLYTQTLVPSNLGDGFKFPLPQVAIDAYPGIQYAQLNGVILTKSGVLGADATAQWNSYNNGRWYVVEVFPDSTCKLQNDINPPPPPNIEPQDCKCMCNDNLVKLLLQRIGNLPATVPDNFASKTPKPITLDSLAEIAIWQAQQIDALAGQYPIPLTIKADPTDSNSKDQHLELPNQAEALAEILGLLVTTKRDTHATLVGIIKVLAESGMIKNLATQTYDVTHANAEFLGYKLEQVKRTIPSTFTPNGNNLAETFKETNIDITSYENKDSTDLQDDLKKLLQMAARWNAQNWRTIGANAAVSLAQNFMGNVDTVQNTHEAIKQETFADFLKEVEQGFTHAEGVTDANDPWGNPANEAPTVRQIGITAESAAEAQQQVATSNALTGRSDSVTKDVAVQTAITKIANTLKAL